MINIYGMAIDRKEFLDRLKSICRKMEAASNGRVCLVGEKTQDMGSFHRLTVDGQGIGLYLEELEMLCVCASPSYALANFAQYLALIKAKGYQEAYEAIREDCDALAGWVDENHRSRWRDIFSISAKKENECNKPPKTSDAKTSDEETEQNQTFDEG